MECVDRESMGIYEEPDATETLCKIAAALMAFSTPSGQAFIEIPGPAPRICPGM